MPFELTYKVATREDGGKPSYCVVTNTMKGEEYACTRSTREKATAEKWCRTLRGAARVETDRRKAVLSGKRRIDDD